MISAISLAAPQLFVISRESTVQEIDDRLDVELMGRIGEGDEEAMRQLIERHQAKVIGTIIRMLGSEREAEDLAQQVFIRIWKSAGRYKATAKFTTWLFTIVRNLVFNESRRRKLHDPAAEIDPNASDVRQTSPSAEFLDKEKMASIEAAIQALPEQQRMAVILRRYEDIPYEEMAAILNLSVPSVKSLLFRARTTLREALRKYLE